MTDIPTMTALAAGKGNRCFIIGEPVANWQDMDLTKERVELTIDGNKIQSSVGGHPDPRPANLVVWQANHLNNRGAMLKKGDVIATGSVVKGGHPVVAGQRAVDENVDAHVSALGRMLVGRHHVIDHRFDECRFIEIQKRVSRRRSGRALRLRGLRCGHCRRRSSSYCAAGNGTLQKIAAAEAFVFFVFVFHDVLHASCVR